MSDSVPIETAHEDMIVGASTTLISLGLFTKMRFQHDAQLDYYGKRLATCSSDRTVKVFDVIDGEPQRTSGGQTLKGCAFFWVPAFAFLRLMLHSFSISFSHTGPVWQVAWAHPKYGHILASSSYDGKVLIWKEQQAQGNTGGGWVKIKEHTLHTASGMWAPC